MTNTWSPISDIRENGAGLIAGEMLEELIPLFESPGPELDSNINSIDLHRYAGRYGLESLAEFTVTVTGERLLQTCVQHPAYKEFLVPREGNTFGFRNRIESTHRFHVDKNGEVTGMTFGPFALKRQGR